MEFPRLREIVRKIAPFMIDDSDRAIGVCFCCDRRVRATDGGRDAHGRLRHDLCARFANRQQVNRKDTAERFRRALDIMRPLRGVEPYMQMALNRLPARYDNKDMIALINEMIPHLERDGTTDLANREKTLRELRSIKRQLMGYGPS